MRKIDKYVSSNIVKCGSKGTRSRKNYMSTHLVICLHMHFIMHVGSCQILDLILDLRSLSTTQINHDPSFFPLYGFLLTSFIHSYSPSFPL